MIAPDLSKSINSPERSARGTSAKGVEVLQSAMMKNKTASHSKKASINPYRPPQAREEDIISSQQLAGKNQYPFSNAARGLRTSSNEYQSGNKYQRPG